MRSVFGFSGVGIAVSWRGMKEPEESGYYWFSELSPEGLYGGCYMDPFLYSLLDISKLHVLTRNPTLLQRLSLGR